MRAGHFFQRALTMGCSPHRTTQACRRQRTTHRCRRPHHAGMSAPTHLSGLSEPAQHAGVLPASHCGLSSATAHVEVSAPASCPPQVSHGSGRDEQALRFPRSVVVGDCVGFCGISRQVCTDQGLGDERALRFKISGSERAEGCTDMSRAVLKEFVSHPRTSPFCSLRHYRSWECDRVYRCLSDRVPLPFLVLASRGLQTTWHRFCVLWPPFPKCAVRYR